MLASLLGALVGAAPFAPDLAAFQPTLSPISFDPAPISESYTSEDSVYTKSGWVVVAGSRVVQSVSSRDASGRPTSVRVVANTEGVADTSVRTQTWLNSQILETLKTSFSFSSIPVSLELASSVSGSTVSQSLAMSSMLFKANVAARDTLVLNGKGHPTSLTLWTLDTAGMFTKLMSGAALSLLPAARSFTGYASDTMPQARAIQSWVSGAWKVVDSSRVELVNGIPVILHHTDSTGTTRDSLVWNSGRLVERIGGGQVTTFSYDASGRVLKRLTSQISGDLRLPISSTSWSYEAPAGIGRYVHAPVLSISNVGQNRTALLRLEKSTIVRVSVHGIDGRLIGLLANGQLPAGVSSFSLNGIRGAAIVKVKGSGISATASLPSP